MAKMGLLKLKCGLKVLFLRVAIYCLNIFAVYKILLCSLRDIGLLFFVTWVVLVETLILILKNIMKK